MNYEEMELEDLKKVAKSMNISFGRIGKEKLIAKIKETENSADDEDAVASVINDSDLDEISESEDIQDEQDSSPTSLLESISSAIDDLEDSETEEITPAEDLPLDEKIPVKSMTFGILIYKSRTTSAVYRWENIGAIQYMTVAELNEMNNYRSDFLRKPRVILMDERAVSKFRLTPVYENVAKINNLTKVFKQKPEVIEQTIDNALRVNMRDVLISKVSQMYKNGKLTDINVLRLLERKLHFDLTELE